MMWGHSQWSIATGFGLVKPRPVVKDGKIVAVPSFILTLVYDRRIMSGSAAVKFFKRLVDLLENPVEEMEESNARESATIAKSNGALKEMAVPVQ
jgi:pyruvate/2-oxoglutarate dehydrogenase complex dihydrolipoamide acyltransferase (E2) component